MARRDLSFTIDLIKQQYIGSVYPEPKAFADRLERATLKAEESLPLVVNFSGYRAVLRRFITGFDDEHVGISFNISSNRILWPGFIAAYEGRRYVVANSVRADVLNGSEITSCDDRPIQTLIDELANVEGGHPGRESTKASTALSLFADPGSPLFVRPQYCVISGKLHKLNWQSIATPSYLAATRTHRFSDRATGITDFGTVGAWVRLGIFAPDSTEEAESLQKVIANVSSIRDKSYIIIDVRGNGGGPYNWFMEFLRGLYGSQYADYFARARLSIRPVYRATPEIADFYRDSDAESQAFSEPIDPPRNQAPGPDISTAGVIAAVATGQPWFRDNTPPLPRPSKSPPKNPVKAKVYVLTDYGCASACIAFVDEMKLFPGVTQIGLETYVDERTGTGIFMALPSGNGLAWVATMTRDGRARGDAVLTSPPMSLTATPRTRLRCNDGSPIPYCQGTALPPAQWRIHIALHASPTRPVSKASEAKAIDHLAKARRRHPT